MVFRYIFNIKRKFVQHKKKVKNLDNRLLEKTIGGYLSSSSYTCNTSFMYTLPTAAPQTVDILKPFSSCHIKNLTSWWILICRSQVSSTYKFSFKCFTFYLDSWNTRCISTYQNWYVCVADVASIYEQSKQTDSWSTKNKNHMPESML